MHLIDCRVADPLQLSQREFETRIFLTGVIYLSGGLTAAGVLVDLSVGLDLDRGSLRHLWDPAVQFSADQQVIVFIDATELLPDGQPLVPGLEDHLGLPREYPSCRDPNPGNTFRLTAGTLF